MPHGRLACTAAEELNESLARLTAPPNDCRGLSEEDAPRTVINRGPGVDLRGLVISPDGCGAASDIFEPAREVGELVDILALTLVRNDPGI
jgi:hypothetical protein